jgi:hypothetical protein
MVSRNVELLVRRIKVLEDVVLLRSDLILGCRLRHDLDLGRFTIPDKHST